MFRQRQCTPPPRGQLMMKNPGRYSEDRRRLNIVIIHVVLHISRRTKPRCCKKSRTPTRVRPTNDAAVCADKLTIKRAATFRQAKMVHYTVVAYCYCSPYVGCPQYLGGRRHDRTTCGVFSSTFHTTGRFCILSSCGVDLVGRFVIERKVTLF